MAEDDEPGLVAPEDAVAPPELLLAAAAPGEELGPDTDAEMPPVVDELADPGPGEDAEDAPPEPPEAVPDDEDPLDAAAADADAVEAEVPAVDVDAPEDTDEEAAGDDAASDEAATDDADDPAPDDEDPRLSDDDEPPAPPLVEVDALSTRRQRPDGSHACVDGHSASSWQAAPSAHPARPMANTTPTADHAPRLFMVTHLDTSHRHPAVMVSFPQEHTNAPRMGEKHRGAVVARMERKGETSAPRTAVERTAQLAIELHVTERIGSQPADLVHGLVQVCAAGSSGATPRLAADGTLRWKARRTMKRRRDHKHFSPWRGHHGRRTRGSTGNDGGVCPRRH